MKIVTGGVLVLASSKGLKEEYLDKEFDYEFPDGINKLLSEQKIVALTTSDGDDIVLDIKINTSLPTVDFYKEIDQFITLMSEDELLILSHAEFTGICRKKGDHVIYGWPVKKIEGLSKGTYHCNIGVENVSNDFDKYQAYFKLTITLNRVEIIKHKNRVFEISY